MHKKYGIYQENLAVIFMSDYLWYLWYSSNDVITYISNYLYYSHNLCVT